jgi:ATP-dependent DNA helicase RecQ
MSRVIGEQAFLYLREALSGHRDPQSFDCGDVPFNRLRLAIHDKRLSSLDRAVRLRHALRHAQLTLASEKSARSLPMPRSSDWPDATETRKCGLTVRAGGEVEALPWVPDWLHGVSEAGADAAAMQEAMRPWTHKYPAADYWIQELFAYKYYRGPGQALAVRSALHMPVNKTLLAVMPTGEGKSLVFQALAAAHPNQIVAVVVPTVALARDHANSLLRVEALKPFRAHAYVGGEGAKNAEILAGIAKGDQGLVFSAPESFIGRLRQPLLEAAKFGQLAAFVIDEAHLVDAWGADFRNEFQLLGALVAELRAVAPVHQQPRVICLSATVTQEAHDTLETLFAPKGGLSLVPAARLRPEIDTWIAEPTGDVFERERHVLDALFHLPRPAILYVTRQQDADNWGKTLAEAGFGRISVLHGGSTNETRKNVVDAWRTGELDLVVGTSAFGLGIDYPHVRTVIHACIPESLDRYYQEVGRSGRDGRASGAVLVPDQSDEEIAVSVASKKIISVEKGIQRWRSMFLSHRRDYNAPARFLIDPTVSPPYDPDMQGERNEDWNGRVLSLMARSRLISLAGLQFDTERKITVVAIDVLRDDHLEPRVWDTLVESQRQSLLNASNHRFKDMMHLLASRVCPAERLSKLYALRHDDKTWPVEIACGGCRSCRTTRKDGWFAHWPNPPTAPWNIGKLSERLNALCDRGRCFVERNAEDVNTLLAQRRLKEMIEGLWNDGLRKCIVIGALPTAARAVLSECPWCVAQGKDRQILSSNGLPPGPELIWVADDAMLGEHDLQPREAGTERIYILPFSPSDPSRAGRSLADRFQLVTFSLLRETLQT